jgi:NADH-quinone oxidoreductase subunit H
MPDSSLTTVAPAWAVVAAGLLGLLAVGAAVLDGALAGRGDALATGRGIARPLH